MKLLVIIPAYNEQENITRVVDNLTQDYPQYDYVVVNDGGHDSTARICRERGYHLLSLPINVGLAGAFQCGMKYAYKHGYDAAVQLDADGQHLPQYIAPMLDQLAQGYDIVAGSRYVCKKKPWSLRMLGSRVISTAIKLTTGQTYKDPTSGMRMYNCDMIKIFAKEQNHSPEPDTISYLLRRGLRLAEVQVTMEERIAGKSYLSAMRSVKYMLRMGVSILLVQWFRGGTELVHTDTPKEAKK